MLHDACRTAELDAVSFWVHVPHYANNPPCPKATLALLHRVEEVLDIPVPWPTWPRSRRSGRSGCAPRPSRTPSSAEYVRELEERAGDDLTPLSGDEIAQQFERYLRRRGGQAGPTASR